MEIISVKITSVFETGAVKAKAVSYTHLTLPTNSLV